MSAFRTLTRVVLEAGEAEGVEPGEAAVGQPPHVQLPQSQSQSAEVEEMSAYLFSDNLLFTAYLS